jgi:hypothetical protein
MGDMLTTLRIFSDARPIDIWMVVIEVLVLAIIAYEAGSDFHHKHKLRGWLAGIFGLVSKGQNLQKHAPRSGPLGNADPAAIDPWIKSVHEWSEETANFLKKYSTQAVVAFYQGVQRDAEYPGIAWNAQNMFGHLLLRLNNLQRIMEKPDVYL